MKKLAAVITVLAMAITFAASSRAEDAQTVRAAPRATVLVDASTGQLLCGSNARERLAIASVTKVMCLLLWAEDIAAGKLSFDDTIPCSSYASSRDGSVIWLEASETMSARDMLKSVVIASANDACTALAEYVCGSEEEFVKRMNERALKLGMTDTHFTNCVGYDEPEHYSSAYDAALMTAELMKHECYAEFYVTRLDSVRMGTKRETQLLNTNKLANKYNGIIGAKTGTTDNAGCCLAVCAQRGNMRLVAVVLGAGDDDTRFSSGAVLLDYGFDSFRSWTPKLDSGKLGNILVENGVYKEVQVAAEHKTGRLLPSGRTGDVVYEYNIADKAEARINAGQVLGNVTASLDGEVIYSSNIIAVRTIEELTVKKSAEIILTALFCTR